MRRRWLIRNRQPKITLPRVRIVCESARGSRARVFLIMAKKPTKPKAKTSEPEKKARVHKELDGFEIGVNPLGEITSNYSIEQVNEFLGRHVRDKKIVHREGQFGEEARAKTAAETARLAREADELLPLDDTEADELEESDEDFMRRTSREAKRKKTVSSEADEAAETRRELPE